MSRETYLLNSYFPILHLQQYPTKYYCSNKIQLVGKKNTLPKHFFQKHSLRTAIIKSSFIQELVMSQMHFSHLNACLHKESLCVNICTENVALRA